MVLPGFVDYVGTKKEKGNRPPLKEDEIYGLRDKTNSYRKADNGVYLSQYSHHPIRLAGIKEGPMIVLPSEVTGTCPYVCHTYWDDGTYLGSLCYYDCT